MNGKTRLDKIELRIQQLPRPLTREEIDSEFSRLLGDMVRHCGPEEVEQILIGSKMLLPDVVEMVGELVAQYIAARGGGLDRVREDFLDRIDDIFTPWESQKGRPKNALGKMVDALPKASQNQLRAIVEGTRLMPKNKGSHVVKKLPAEDRVFLAEVFPSYYAWI